MVQIEWKDAPPTYMQKCLNKKDVFEAADFVKDYKTVKIDRAPPGPPSRSSNSSSSSSLHA